MGNVSLVLMLSSANPKTQFIHPLGYRSSLDMRIAQPARTHHTLSLTPLVPIFVFVYVCSQFPTTPALSSTAPAGGHRQLSNDHPCDLRLLVPDTCLKELATDQSNEATTPLLSVDDVCVDDVRVEDDIEECEDEDDDDEDGDGKSTVKDDRSFDNDECKFGSGDGLDEPIDIDSFGFEPSRFFDIKSDAAPAKNPTTPKLNSLLTPPPSGGKRAALSSARRKAANAKLNALAVTLASSNPVTVGGAYKCKKCCNSYARLHSLNRHLRFECGVEPQFECPVCHKKSKHKHNLVLHMRTHRESAARTPTSLKTDSSTYI